MPGIQIMYWVINNVFTFKKIWAVCPYILSVSLIRCTNEALKKLHQKSTINPKKAGGGGGGGGGGFAR